MFKWIKEKIDERKIKKTEANLAEYGRILKEKKEKEFNLIDGALQKRKEKMMSSNEPWIEIMSSEHDPENGIKLHIEWNDAFIKYAKSAGINGVDDDAIVQKYLAGIWRDVDRKEQYE